MQLAENLNVLNPFRLLDLREILMQSSDWPADVTCVVDARSAEISAIIGGGLKPAEATFDMLWALGPHRLRQIWNLLPCPWCGRSDAHDNLRALTVEEMQLIPRREVIPPEMAVVACPLRASKENFDGALAEWQIARRNARHGCHFMLQRSLGLTPYSTMGYQRDRIIIGQGYSSLSPSPEQQYDFYLTLDREGRALLNQRVLELLSEQVVTDSIEGLCEAIREALAMKASMPN